MVFDGDGGPGRCVSPQCTGSRHTELGSWEKDGATGLCGADASLNWFCVGLSGATGTWPWWVALHTAPARRRWRGPPPRMPHRSRLYAQRKKEGLQLLTGAWNSLSAAQGGRRRIRATVVQWRSWKGRWGAAPMVQLPLGGAVSHYETRGRVSEAQSPVEVRNYGGRATYRR